MLQIKCHFLKLFIFYPKSIRGKSCNIETSSCIHLMNVCADQQQVCLCLIINCKTDLMYDKWQGQCPVWWWDCTWGWWQSGAPMSRSPRHRPCSLPWMSDMINVKFRSVLLLLLLLLSLLTTTHPAYTLHTLWRDSRQFNNSMSVCVAIGIEKWKCLFSSSSIKDGKDRDFQKY